MRVNLKGIHRVRKRLADGSVRLYFYAWRGGPRLEGQPGTREFIASYNKAVEASRAPTSGDVNELIRKFRASTDYTGLAVRTRQDYEKQLAKVRDRFGAFPLALLGTKAARGQFLEWRDEQAVTSKRQADYAWTVLARVLSWAKHRGLIDTNPCEKGGRIYKADRTEKVWTDEQEAAFMASAGPHLQLALQLALWTGQRQGDLLRARWSDYDGKHLKLRQGKTKVHMRIPLGAPLVKRLDETPRRAATILTNMDGDPWTADGFRSSWRKACATAKIAGVTFHDLRGTAISRLAEAGSTVPEIATFTGHSLDDVNAILDAHYFSRNPEMGESAKTKLEKRAASL